MTISAVNATTQSTPQTQVPASGSVLSSDFETFLKMLTVQMQNQDPLNPTDTTEFATQLATFSSLEQQVLTNALLETLSTAISGADPLDTAHLLGHQVQVNGPVPFDGTAVDLAVTVAEDADAATLSVRNTNGNLVQTLPFNPDQTTVAWSGVAADGVVLPSGPYTIEVESWSGQDSLGSIPVARHATVLEIRAQEGGTSLILSDGAQVDATDIVGIRTTTGTP